ncbi:MAG: pyrroline-5-carboxylate reductase, partial [Mycobacteriaceae bacterium]
MTRIAILGGGKIGEALIAGLIKSGHPAKDLVVAEKSTDRAEELSGRYGIRAATITDAVEGANVLVIAVKPNDVDAVLAQIGEADVDDRHQVVVSLVAGLPASRYESKLAVGTPVIRVMPNTPMLVGKGVSVLAAGRFAKPEHLDTVQKIMGSVGMVATVKEEQMDVVTAVSGSGPAYFFLVAEAMIDGAVALGLARDVATQLVVGTIVGSAAMLESALSTDESATDLRAAVTSP